MYSDAEWAEALLWAGFGNVASRKLEAITTDPRQPAREIAVAAWALARWYVADGEHERALNQLTLKRRGGSVTRAYRQHIVLEVEALLRLGRAYEAKHIVEHAIQSLGEVPELCFCAANAAAFSKDLSQHEIDQLRLDWLSKPLVSAGLAPLKLKDSSKPLSLDNVTAATVPTDCSADRPKITVLMAAFNAAETIATAMNSILQQTWANLELVTVDDGSSDGTWSIIQSFAARDPRVVVVRQQENRGAYASRNVALRHATGDFVTVHDSDDWSHPQKLALQADALLSSDSVANTTKQVLVHPCLRVHVMPSGAIIRNCYPSLMMRRAVVLGLGGWDECRMGADDELWKRLLLKYPASSRVIFENSPISLHLLRAQSLTSQSSIGKSTIRYGARRQYIEAYRHWHRLEMTKAVPNFRLGPDARRFPIPGICQPGPQRTLEYDILFVSDFSLPDRANMTMITAAHRLGFRSACFHWPHLESVGRDVDTKVRHLMHERFTDCVVGGERIVCKLVIANRPSVLINRPDILLEVQTKHCVLMLDQAPLCKRNTTDIDKLVNNAMAVFGVMPHRATKGRLLSTILDELGMQRTALVPG